MTFINKKKYQGCYKYNVTKINHENKKRLIEIRLRQENYWLTYWLHILYWGHFIPWLNIWIETKTIKRPLIRPNKIHWLFQLPLLSSCEMHLSQVFFFLFKDLFSKMKHTIKNHEVLFSCRWSVLHTNKMTSTQLLSHVCFIS